MLGPDWEQFAEPLDQLIRLAFASGVDCTALHARPNKTRQLWPDVARVLVFLKFILGMAVYLILILDSKTILK